MVRCDIDEYAEIIENLGRTSFGKRSHCKDDDNLIEISEVSKDLMVYIPRRKI